MISTHRIRATRAVLAQWGSLLAFAFLAVPFRSAAAAETWATPTPNQLFQFQNANRNHPWLHIHVDSGMVERKVLRLDPSGLRDMRTLDGQRLPGPLEWGRIQRIDEVVTRASPWGKVGVVALGSLGAGLGNALGAPDQQGGPLALAGLVVFGEVGHLLGGRYGSRFRSERSWYVADTARQAEPANQAAVLAAAIAPTADPAILIACDRIGRHERFRARGSFGTFQGYADLAGPGGLEALRPDTPAGVQPADAPPPRLIPWDQIDRVEMRGGSAMRGAIGMGASFAIIGALLGGAAVALNPGAEITAPEAAGIGAIYLAPVGAVIGALGGMAARRWVPVYRRH